MFGDWTEYGAVNLEIENLRDKGKQKANEQNHEATITMYNTLNPILNFLKAKVENRGLTSLVPGPHLLE